MDDWDTLASLTIDHDVEQVEPREDRSSGRANDTVREQDCEQDPKRWPRAEIDCAIRPDVKSCNNHLRARAEDGRKHGGCGTLGYVEGGRAPCEVD